MAAQDAPIPPHAAKPTRTEFSGGTTKLRWRIERDYHEHKQEVGLGHFEGRGWRGFRHHAALCIAAYGFLLFERETVPPSAIGFIWPFKETTLPETYRPRGAAIAA